MTRSVVTIEDLTDDEIEAIFELADRFLADMSTPGKPHRIQGRADLADQSILATLFFEPSTRTRLSFESAMHRMGGRVISCPEGGGTSSAKGESIADTIRVVENYADIIVLRHPWEGAAQVAADYADVPVINAGDGTHEHPTQTLCDLYTLRTGQRRKTEKASLSLKESLRGLTVVLCGDLHHGRTVHSLVYALARFGARIVPLITSAEFDFPEHVRRRLARDFNCFPLSKEDLPDSLPADVLYITPEKPHQLSLLQPDALDLSITLSKKEQKAIKGIKGVDVFYATRLQVERMDSGEAAADYPVINAEFLKKKPYKHSQVMHPLPRVDELGYDMDEDKRGVYFQQASYGVPVRMALMAALLELQPALSSSAEPRTRYAVYKRSDGIRCNNAKCVMAQESEQRYLSPKFWIVDEHRLTIRCAYCDHEQQPQIISRASTRKYRTDISSWKEISSTDLVLFLNEEQARKAGHQPKKTKSKPTSISPPSISHA